MAKRKLNNITLLGIDCLNVERLAQAMKICQRDFEFAQVKLLTSLPTKESENIIKIDPINSVEAYSNFVLFELDKYIDTDYILLVQYDGFILNPAAWSDEFLKYDYIGAPWLIADWSVKMFDVPRELLGQRIIGNGGFSLRSKKLLSLTAKLGAGKITRPNPEDMAICIYHRDLMEQNDIKFAPINLAQQFSFESESQDNYKWNDQFGFHGLKWTDISKWTDRHPEYKIDNPAIKKKFRDTYL
jgi:hypothetical protein